MGLLGMASAFGLQRCVSKALEMEIFSENDREGVAIASRSRSDASTAGG